MASKASVGAASAGIPEPTDEQIAEFVRGFLYPFADLCKRIAAGRGQTVEKLAAELAALSSAPLESDQRGGFQASECGGDHHSYHQGSLPRGMPRSARGSFTSSACKARRSSRGPQ
jgi:hypothetical protein